MHAHTLTHTHMNDSIDIPTANGFMQFNDQQRAVNMPGSAAMLHKKPEERKTANQLTCLVMFVRPYWYTQYNLVSNTGCKHHFWFVYKKTPQGTIKLVTRENKLLLSGKNVFCSVHVYSSGAAMRLCCGCDCWEKTSHKCKKCKSKCRKDNCSERHTEATTHREECKSWLLLNESWRRRCVWLYSPQQLTVGDVNIDSGEMK